MISFDTPLPFNAALDFLRKKKAMPTSLSTADLSELSQEQRKLSLYSARTTCLGYLGPMGETIQGIVDGSINEATGRQDLQKQLDILGYNPTTHFGTDADKAIPPAEPGTLRDLSSDRRIKLMLQMNVRLSQNVGFMRAGMDPAAIDQFPCWELVRIFPKVKERGDWEERWVKAGGTLVGGRMVARKDDPIWQNLGDSSLFPDGTDSDAPPYAYESGMGLRNVPRKEAIALGVIDPDDDIKPSKPGLLSFLDTVPKSSVPLADMKADRNQLLAAAAALRKKAA